MTNLPSVKRYLKDITVDLTQFVDYKDYQEIVSGKTYTEGHQGSETDRTD